MHLKLALPLAYLPKLQKRPDHTHRVCIVLFNTSSPVSNTMQNATENCFAPFLAIAGQCQTLSAFVESAKIHLRSVLPLALLSAFSAAQETQIESAIYFLTKVSQYETPSAFPESAKMQLKTALPLS